MESTRLLCFTSATPMLQLRGARGVAALDPFPRRLQVAAGRTRAARALTAPRMATPVGTDARDVLLGELAFTEPDLLPALVESRMGRLNEEFYEFVNAKIAASSDLQERETLRVLMDAVKDIQAQVSKGASFAAVVEGGSAETLAEVSIEDEKALADATYDALIDRLVKACEEDGLECGDALATTVAVVYEEMDKRFLDRLHERSTNKEDESWKTLAMVKAAVALEMGSRVTAAAEKVKLVLGAGSPDGMRKELERLAVKGGVDDAFVLLLQGNIQQAQEAGATAAVQVLSSALQHAAMLKDARLPAEIRLIRRLLRTNDSEARISMLMDALTPKKAVFLADGSKSTGVRVNGKKFVEALRDIIEKYGNVDSEFVQKLSEIGEESEAVARKVFDMEDKDVRDLQEEAFAKRAVSVWDLEKVEMAEEVEGRKAAWEGRLGNMPTGFDEHGKMQI